LHNRVQVFEKMMVVFSEIADKQSQQRRGRVDGANRSAADRNAVEEDRALAPETAEASPGWPAVDRESSRFGRDSLDSAERRSLAGPTGEISTSFDLLAAFAGLGGAGRVVENLASVPERVERTPAVEMERVVSGRQFCPGEKGGAEVGKTKRGKGTKWMVVVDGRGVPLGNSLHSASPSEMRLAEQTLATIRVGRRHRAGRPRQKPLRVIADKGYDCDALRKRLRRRGIVLIAPLRLNRRRTPPQDGRILRRYKRRWIVERTFAWLGNFRHLVIRYDRSLTIYRAFFHIACFMIVLRRVVQ
jgi:transposase